MELPEQLELNIEVSTSPEVLRKIWRTRVMNFFEKHSTDLVASAYAHYFSIMNKKHHTDVKDTCIGVEIISIVYIVSGDGFISAEFIQVSDDVPKTVSEAFSRNLWYSRWNFADIFLFKVNIHARAFFFLLHIGFVDDGWENDIYFAEVFTEEGEILCAADASHVDSPDWYDREFTHQEYKRYAKECLYWPEHVPSGAYSEDSVWTENKLVKESDMSEKTGQIMVITPT